MRGVPLEEIAAATKISVRSLQALEAEEFSKLPGGIFTRSFIRAYAKYLGLDEETVMGEYQALAPRKEEADLSRLSLSKPKPPREGSLATVMGLLLAILLLGGAYWLFRYSHRTTESLGTVPNSNPLGATPTPAGTQPPSTTQSATTTGVPSGSPAGTVAGQTSAGPAAQDASKSSQVAAVSTPAVPKISESDPGLTLQVAATEQVWVAVEADGATVLQRLLKPNDIQTFKAKDSFDVRTGNAQGVILTLNNETLKPLGHRGEFKKVHLTRDDLKNLGP